MADATPRWALPMLFAGQAQKEIFHNEALTALDMLLHGVALSADLATPPTAPTAGEAWIVATGATGAWSGRDGRLAGWTEGGWRFVSPRAGLTIYVVDRGHAMTHDGDGWHDAALQQDGLHLAGVRVVGTRRAAIAAPAGGATTDAEARDAIGAILTALRMHGLIES